MLSSGNSHRRCQEESNESSISLPHCLLGTGLRPSAALPPPGPVSGSKMDCEVGCFGSPGARSVIRSVVIGRPSWQGER